MANHPFRARLPQLANKAWRLGYLLTPHPSLQQGDDGFWRARWRLHALVNGRPSPYAGASAYFKTLREVDDALDRVENAAYWLAVFRGGSPSVE